MKNLKNVLGLLALVGFAFGFANTSVNAKNYNGSVASDVEACISSSDAYSTCNVTGDVTISANKIVTGAVKLNITNGKTLTVSGPITVSNGAKLTISGGTIKASSSTDAEAIIVNSGATLKTDDVKLESVATTPNHYTQAVISVLGGINGTSAQTNVTIGKNTKVHGYAGIIIYQSGYSSSGGGSNGYSENVTVKLDGTWETTGYTVQTFGRIQNGNGPKVEIAGGSYTSKERVALYASGIGDWTITGGKFTGAEAMTVKAGKVAISGGDFIANSSTCSLSGTNNHTSTPTSNAEATGAALNIITDTGYYKHIDLDVTGGTFRSEKCAALFTYSGDASNSLEVTGGSFTSPENVEVVYRTGSNMPTNFISGGSFVGKTTALTAGGALSNSLSKSTVNGVTYVGEGYEATIEADQENGTIDSLVGDKIDMVAGVTYKISDFIEVTPDDGYHVVYTVVDNDDKAVEVKNGEFEMPKSNVTIKVSFAEGTEPEPENPEQKPSTGDNEPEENPKTFDAIGSLVAMAVSSLGVIGTATKKVLR